jgi:hypothetical protein
LRNNFRTGFGGINNMKTGTRRYTLSVLFIAMLQSAGAQYQNIRINNPYSLDPEEVSLAVNPNDPQNIAAGANLKYIYNSTNGGFNWREARMASTYGVWGDPCLMYDRLGNLYYVHLSNPSSNGYWIDRIVVQKSTDGGYSWTTGAGIGYDPPIRQQDKAWLGTDMTNSQFRDNIYVAWTEFDRYGSSSPTDSTRILFSRSTDHGESWAAPVRISDHGGNCVDSDSTVEGAVPAIGPNGEVYLSWSGPLGIMFDKSTDGGVTFGADIFVASQPGGWDFTIPGIFRSNGMPITSCDIGMSPFRGAIYINWSDQRNGTDNTDIFFIKSTDQGETWSSPLKVNSDTGAHQQFFSWMTVDQSTGYIYIDYYDRRNSAGLETDVYISKSTDGGNSFSDVKVSESSFIPRPDVFFGDYTNIGARHGHIYPIWMRLDSTVLSVWTAQVNDQPTQQVVVRGGWNMVSLPVDPDEKSASTLFSSAVSHAFAFKNGYEIADTMNSGSGYWYNFSSAGSIPITGTIAASESVHVVTGWNLIGAVSSPASVSNITSNPPGMVISNIYGYDGSNYIVVDSLTPGQGYWVRAQENGSLFIPSFTPHSIAGRIHVVAGAEQPPAPPDPAQIASVPHKFMLAQNYPNPFNPSTLIRYSVPHDGNVLIKVYNTFGQEIRTLIDGVQHAGEHQVSFRADHLPSGVYFYRLMTGSLTDMKKMMVIK